MGHAGCGDFGIVFGSTMEQLSILTQPDAHSYFLLDGSFPHFYYLTNDRYGEAILRLLCDTQQRRTLDAILADGLYERIPNWLVENDAIDSEGNPVLFAYTCDFPRIRRFDTALELHGMTGDIDLLRLPGRSLAGDLWAVCDAAKH